MSDLDTRLVDLTDVERERLRRSLERFNDAMTWQLKHAEDELARDRLRRLFGTGS
ncbi:hypothetical protein PBI_VALIDUS_95 [Mycobacterium phage Validus]|uniref:Uncharacterized protein n=1 Tax=Mycobacterium phage Validus TaxID=1414747 RepID=V5UQF3_9CAUD|nr:hypothetical protein CC50_gp016 [Mycobacterium phage Validus]AHB79625.1 hypothetical protein PBI_VALIDUS_95 [Mycobacterium phage Validus]